MYLSILMKKTCAVDKNGPKQEYKVSCKALFNSSQTVFVIQQA